MKCRNSIYLHKKVNELLVCKKKVFEILQVYKKELKAELGICVLWLSSQRYFISALRMF